MTFYDEINEIKKTFEELDAELKLYGIEPIEVLMINGNRVWKW